ncbi:hypothetical protein UPYG_G00335050 [Umbra pygmaea]|uniref:BHLH domain-containing protein n=1 Tax=Umbra pygmaea TaxID=75934 RepID=A0ABD0WEC4_UMBPY
MLGKLMSSPMGCRSPVDSTDNSEEESENHQRPRRGTRKHRAYQRRQRIQDKEPDETPDNPSPVEMGGKRWRGSDGSDISNVSSPSSCLDDVRSQRVVANVRERQRTQSLNEAFASLREIIPTMPSDKLSKIQTLKLATRYIDFLHHVLRSESLDPDEACSSAAASCVHGAHEHLSKAFSLWRMDGGAC